MIRVLSFLAIVLGGGSLGAFGLYLGYKLSRYRPHRESEEIQTLFTLNKLDDRDWN
jgi:hypothetical protein